MDKPAAGDVTVETLWSGVSAGTERLLFEGRMPAFPGMGYPLVPGYESVGRVVDAGPEAKIAIGTQVFVPGAKCFGDSVRCVHGGAASLLVAPASRVVPVSAGLGENAVLLALAATALHALARLARSKGFLSSAMASSAACWRDWLSPLEASLRSYGKPTAFGRAARSDTRSRRPTQMRERTTGRSSMSAAIPRSSIRSYKNSRGVARLCSRDFTIV